MGFSEISLIVSIALGVSLLYELCKDRLLTLLGQKHPVKGHYRCGCGMDVQVSGYSAQVTEQVITKVRELHRCEEQD